MGTIVKKKTFLNFPKEDILTKFAPDALREIENDQTSIPKLAKHDALLRQIDFILPNLPTFHHFHGFFKASKCPSCGDISPLLDTKKV